MSDLPSTSDAQQVPLGGRKRDVAVQYRQVRCIVASQPVHDAASTQVAHTYPAPAVQYCGEKDIHYVMDLVDNELSEPYSIFTYRWGPCMHPARVAACMSAAQLMPLHASLLVPYSNI